MTGKAYYRMLYQDYKLHLDKFKQSHWMPCVEAGELTDDTEIVVYVEADEGAHLALESDSNLHAMSSITAGSTMCSDCVTALQHHGVTAEDNMYKAARKLAQSNPALRPARF